MSTVSTPAEQRVVLDEISWSTYLAILEDTGNRRGRIAYDRGILEIMSPSKAHEQIKKLLARMIEAFTEELDIDICSVASTTFRREDLKQGIEADECYYIENAAAVRDKEEIDLTIHPPPDLAVEVDISRKSAWKLDIYGALGIVEVWRYDGDAIRVYVHRKAGNYDEVQQSTVLPKMPVLELESFLSRRAEQSETEIIRSFRDWIRNNVV